MPKYVDGYVLPISKKKIAAYQRLAAKAGKIWREHGALQYWECVSEDLRAAGMTPFPKAVKAKKGEVVVFAFVVFKSRAHRDKVNAAVMNDPRLAAMFPDPEDMPFDCKKMLYGGFKTIVVA